MAGEQTLSVCGFLVFEFVLSTVVWNVRRDKTDLKRSTQSAVRLVLALHGRICEELKVK